MLFLINFLHIIRRFEESGLRDIESSFITVEICYRGPGTSKFVANGMVRSFLDVKTLIPQKTKLLGISIHYKAICQQSYVHGFARALSNFVLRSCIVNYYFRYQHTLIDTCCNYFISKSTLCSLFLSFFKKIFGAFFNFPRNTQRNNNRIQVFVLVFYLRITMNEELKNGLLMKR